MEDDEFIMQFLYFVFLITLTSLSSVVSSPALLAPILVASQVLFEKPISHSADFDLKM